MKELVFITGCGRSGLGIIAKAINICGGFGGDMDKMYRNKKIACIIDKYFEKLNCDKTGQNPLPKTEELISLENLRQEIEEIIKKQGYKEGKLFYADCRVTLIWKIWNDVFPNAKWIIVRRRTGDIIYSCMHTAYMDAYNNEEGWKEWVHQYEGKMLEMKKANLNYKIIWPERMVDGDFSQLYEIIDWLELEKKDNIKEEILPLLWKRKE